MYLLAYFCYVVYKLISSVLTVCCRCLSESRPWATEFPRRWRQTTTWRSSPVFQVFQLSWRCPSVPRQTAANWTQTLQPITV